MQDAHGFHDFSGAGGPDPNDMPVFVTSPGDMFSYPLSGSASASLFPDTNMWNSSSSFTGLGLDIDFGTESAGMLQGHHNLSPSQHISMDPSTWDTTNHMFQDSGRQAQDGQVGLTQTDLPNNPSQPRRQQQQRGNLRSQSKQQRPTKRERPIAPKTTTSSVDISFTAVSASLDQVSLGLDNTDLYQASFDDPFYISHTGDGVNPGLLLSRPSSVNMDIPSRSMQPQSHVTLNSASMGDLGSSSQRQDFGISKAPMRELASARPVSSRANTTSSAVKVNTARPVVSRSFSEHRGQKRSGRVAGTNKLPVLAPVTQRPLQSQAQQLQPQRPRSRPSSTGNMRSSGRSSPFKDNHHSRLSSLNSIPETSSQPQLAFRPTLARITVNADGHASVEEVLPSRRTRLVNDDCDEYASSTDDEEIVIPVKPTRPQSYALPDSLKVSGSRPRWQEASGRLLPQEISFQNDEESEAETVINDGAGAAESELRRLRQRQTVKHDSPKKLKISAGRSFSGLAAHPALLSPVTMTEMSLPTPSSRNAVRCACADSPGGKHIVDGLMVQCQSCEMWLHGKCINVNKRNMPSVYICSFCAETPRSRRGVGLAASSPLAHKSFTKFR